MSEPVSRTRLRARVLFVDDDPLVRAAFERVVTPEGWQVDLAATGEHALALARENLYGVMVSDHSLPGMSGPELISALSQLQPNAGLIMVTAHSDLAVASCRLPGLFVVISKPWDNDALLALLSASVRHRVSLEASA